MNWEQTGNCVQGAVDFPFMEASGSPSFITRRGISWFWKECGRHASEIVCDEACLISGEEFESSF